MIDFHSHCLPGLDDGAADVRQSLLMLGETAKQGIHTVVTTPHFYMGQESAGDFIRRRAEARAELEEALAGQKDRPEIRLIAGAEVLICEGISRVDLRPLCIEGTDIVLLEMPLMPELFWLYEEIENIVYGQRLRVMMAHVDRYMPWYSKEGIRRMTSFPDSLIQFNGELLVHPSFYKKLDHWFPDTEGRLVLGSDMHNTSDRAQNLGKAVHKLRHKPIGKEWLRSVEACENMILSRT